MSLFCQGCPGFENMLDCLRETWAVNRPYFVLCCSLPRKNHFQKLGWMAVLQKMGTSAVFGLHKLQHTGWYRKGITSSNSYISFEIFTSAAHVRPAHELHWQLEATNFQSSAHARPRLILGQGGERNKSIFWFKYSRRRKQISTFDFFHSKTAVYICDCWLEQY